MPSKTETQRELMGADLNRLRHGEATRTGMNEKQLREFARKPIRPSGKRSKSRR